MNRNEVASIVGIIIETYPSLSTKHGFDPTRMIDVWTLMLGDINFAIAKAATIKVCRDSRFAPTVADIVAASKELDPRTEKLPSAEEAWGEVQKELVRAGHNLQRKFSHPLIGKAADAIGWLNLCISDNVAADRAHFMRIYTSLAGRQASIAENEQVLQIAGVGDVVKRLAEGMGK
jgi:hypothetical protein